MKLRTKIRKLLGLKPKIVKHTAEHELFIPKEDISELVQSYDLLNSLKTNAAHVAFWSRVSEVVKEEPSKPESAIRGTYTWTASAHSRCDRPYIKYKAVWEETIPFE